MGHRKKSHFPFEKKNGSHSEKLVTLGKNGHPWENGCFLDTKNYVYLWRKQIEVKAIHVSRDKLKYYFL